MASRIKNQASSAFFKSKPRLSGSKKPRKQATRTLKRKGLRRVSKQRREVNVIYQLAVSEFWLKIESRDGYRRCEWTDMSPKYDRYEEERCNKVGELHHKKGRTGSNLTNKSTFMSCCPSHHRYIHDHPNEARRRRYLLT